jgi:hypothetical protein
MEEVLNQIPGKMFESAQELPSSVQERAKVAVASASAASTSAATASAASAAGGTVTKDTVDNKTSQGSVFLHVSFLLRWLLVLLLQC